MASKKSQKEKSILLKLNIFLGFILLFLIFGSFINNNFYPSAKFTVTGHAVSTTPTFTINKDSMDVSIIKGDEEINRLIIYGGESLDKNISINISESLQEIISINFTNFTLLLGATKVIKMNFSSVNVEPGYYSGTIGFDDGKDTILVNINVEIKKLEVFFTIEGTTELGKNLPGNKFYSNIDLTKSGNDKDLNVTLYHDIRDYEGNIYVSHEEEVMIKDKLAFRGPLMIPKGITYGDYILYTKVSYKNITASDSDNIEIGTQDLFFLKTKFWIYLVSIGLIVIIVIVFLKRRQEERKIERSIIQMEALASYDEDAEKDDKKDSKDKKEGESGDDKKDDSKDDSEKKEGEDKK